MYLISEHLSGRAVLERHLTKIFKYDICRSDILRFHLADCILQAYISILTSLACFRPRRRWDVNAIVAVR